MQASRLRTPEAQIVLHELNHRFMNSLQVMAILATPRPGGDLDQQLARLRDCIGALGRLHRLLAAPPSPSSTPSISLGCEQICGALVEAFGRPTTLTILVEDEPIGHALRLDLLLLLTELMTNALKHAGREPLTVSVALSREHQSWRLKVVSNTPGRAGAPRIASALATWLGGELSVDCADGFAVCAALPDPDWPAPARPEPVREDAPPFPDAVCLG